MQTQPSTRAKMYRRVCEVRLFGQNKFDIKQQKYKISDELKSGQARILFGRSAHSINRDEGDDRQEVEDEVDLRRRSGSGKAGGLGGG
jgi:hypothetical protein